jgi:hypothetical protein
VATAVNQWEDVDTALTKTNTMEVLKKLFTTPRAEKPTMSYDKAVLTAELRTTLLNELFETQRSILDKKGYDYAGEDVLSNFRLAGMIVNQGSTHPDAVNCLNLIGTKVARLGQLLSSNKSAQNESVQDSIVDLCNYSALLYLILKMEK